MNIDNDELINIFLDMEKEVFGSFLWRGEDIWPLIRVELFRMLQKYILDIPYIPSYERHRVHEYNLQSAQDFLESVTQSDVLIMDMSSQYIFDKEKSRYCSRVSGGVYDALNRRYSLLTVTLSFKQKQLPDEMRFRALNSGEYSDVKSSIECAEIIKRIAPYFPEVDYSYLMDFFSKLIKYIDEWLLREEQFIALLKKAKPKLVFVTSGYEISEMVVVKASKQLGIKTVELQHGVINKRHIGYRRGDSVSRQYTADYFFSYSDISNEIIGNTFKAHQMYTVGCYYLERAFKESSIKENHNEVLIVLTIADEELLEFAEKLADLAKTYPESIMIKLRIHPEENRKGTRLISMMKKPAANMTFEMPEDVSVYDSIKEAEWVVGTNTTVLYEAAMFGKKCIELIEKKASPSGDFPTVLRAEDLIFMLRNKRNEIGTTRNFYKIGYIDKLNKAVNEILRGRENDKG